MKKIFSFVVVLAAVAMVSCCGNSNKNAAAEAEATEAAASCEGCTEKCDSTAACAQADTTAVAPAAEATK